MITTSLSLLQRVRSGTETQSWNRFVRLYTPVIYGWIRGNGVFPQDVAVKSPSRWKNVDALRVADKITSGLITDRERALFHRHQAGKL